MIKRRLTGIALALASLVLCIVGLEVGLRLVGWGDMMVFTKNAAWGYLMTPGQRVKSYGHPVEINALGLRGPEVASPKRQSVYRVLYLGDSVTYGGGRVEEDELFCRISEAFLSDDGVPVEAVNVSAPGWSPENWSRYVQNKGLLEANMVVAVLPECDLDRAFGTMEHYGFKPRKPHFRLIAVGLKMKAIVAGRSPAQDTGVPKSTPEENVQTNVQAILKVQEQCRVNGTSFLMVFIPSYPASSSAKYWPRFENVADGYLLDLRSELDEPRFFLDGAHLSVEGHGLVGQRLYETIAKLVRGGFGGAGEVD